MSNSLWDTKRVERYIKLYGDPRKQKGSQANLCKDVATLITGKSVLDVGCGIGHLIPFIHPEGAIIEKEYVGWDYSPAMLAKLCEFFPSTQIIQGDATIPYHLFEQEIAYHVLGPIESAVSVSLIIHLPDLEGVRALLRNMWKTATKEIVFGVETMGDSLHTRASGLSIRNISLKTVLMILVDEMEIPRENIHWIHQQMTYKHQTVVHPMKSNPMASTPPNLFQRTTLFHVTK